MYLLVVFQLSSIKPLSIAGCHTERTSYPRGFDRIDTFPKVLRILVGIFAPYQDLDGYLASLQSFQMLRCDNESAPGRTPDIALFLGTFFRSSDDIEYIKSKDHQSRREFVT